MLSGCDSVTIRGCLDGFVADAAFLIVAGHADEERGASLQVWSGS